MTRPSNVSLICLFLTFVCACNKIDDLLTFSIRHQVDLTVESTSPLNLPLQIPTPDVTTNSSQEFQKNNTRADLVKDIKLDELKLTIKNPATQTFSFLKSIHIYISTGQNDEIELAFKDNISATDKTISLTTTKEKLDKYLKASSYKLRTSIVTRESITQDVDVLTDLKFKVTAEAL
jgi:hypothetical protein